MKGIEGGVRDQQVIAVRDAKGVVHHGIFYESNRHGITALVYENGGLHFRVFEDTEDREVEVTEKAGYIGRQALLENVMFEKIDIEHVNFAAFGIDEDVRRLFMIDTAVETRRTWNVGVPLAVALEDAVVVREVLAAGHRPLVVRAAAMHRLPDGELVRDLIAEAHSVGWESDRLEHRHLRVFGAAVAYVYAKSEGIALDDPEGVRFIRTNAIVPELVQGGRIPWLAERLARLNDGRGASTI